MRRLYKFLASTICLIVLNTCVYAQPCATLQIIGPPGGTIPCDSALNLTASVTFPTGINNTNTYIGDTIPFAPAPWIGPNPILVNIDDIWSDSLSLPFPFCFFGNTYNKFLVSSNGQIGFDLSQATLFDAWATTTLGALPQNNASANNSIMGPYHDILPTNTGATITWGVFGVAPCRTMVVSWVNCSMFSCTTEIDTQQIVLHELTNIIDINIASKPLCAGWNGGLAYEGIQNSTGTIAYMTPGRNGTQWTANNDSYRFNPNGPPTPITYTFTWTNALTGAILGTGTTLTLPPPVVIDSIRCTVDVTGGCAPYSFSTVYQVGITKVHANFIYTITYGCDDIVHFTNTTNPLTGTTYSWDFGDGTSSSATNPSHTYSNEGTYTVTLIADHSPCLSDTSVQVIVLFHPNDLMADFTYVKNYGCNGDTVHFTNTTIPPTGTTYTWFFGDMATSTAVNPTHIYATQGTYTVTLIADHLPCVKDTAIHVIVNSHPINAVFSVLDSIGKDSICLGFKVLATSSSTVAAGLVTYSYFWGDGHDTTLSNATPVSHIYTTPGLYTVTHVIKDTLGCIDSVKQNIYVDTPPFETFTVSESKVCVGDPIFIKDSVAPLVQMYEWDFGDGKRIQNIPNPTHSYDAGGDYTITLIGHYRICNDDSVSIDIKVDAYPQVNLGPDTMICPGVTGSILLSNLNDPGALNNVWSTGETSSSITVTEPGRFWLQESSDNAHCTTTDSIWVKRDCYLNIPNSFSPNGDGLNDYFLPRELLSSGLSTFTMNIFNRWGENIFTTSQTDGRGWDGKYNGVDQPLGVYVYIINAGFENGVRKEFKGNVTLIR